MSIIVLRKASKEETELGYYFSVDALKEISDSCEFLIDIDEVDDVLHVLSENGLLITAQ